MPKSNEADEVRVLRFFEDEPIEKAELLFNIVAAKMHERRESKASNGADAPPKPRKVRKPRQETEDGNRNSAPELASA
jgi:hypothetical protein